MGPTCELSQPSPLITPTPHCSYFMENLCDRMLELDRGRCFMHNFGGPGGYTQFLEVGPMGCVDPGCRCLSLVLLLRCLWPLVWLPSALPFPSLACLFTCQGHHPWSSQVSREGKHANCTMLSHWNVHHAQARAARRAAQAAAAADARTLFRREAEWVVKQPKARQAKSQVGEGTGASTDQRVEQPDPYIC